jgi:hypothetical protein
LAETSANVTAVWLGVMIGVNLQTSFLTPPFGFALFYLKGVAPKIVQTIDIWKGAVAFIALQLVGLGIVGFYPTLVNYLPIRTYLTSNVAPPPMNPRLQHCLQEYKFANYNNNESVLRTNISNIQTLDLSYIPENKTEIFNSHIKKALMTFDLVEQVQKAESEYNLFAKNYSSLHFKVRKIQKKVLKIKKKIETLQADIRNLSNDKFSEKEKIEEKIKFLELEKEGLIDKIPQNWIEDNKKFQKIQKNKNITIKKYRRNTDDAYRELTQIKAFIGDAKQLEKLLKAITLLNSEINNENLNNVEKNIDSLIEQLNEISGVDELIEKLSEMNSMATEDEIDKKKIANLNDRILTLFKEEIEWRNKASISLINKLNEYDDSIKNTIGLRLQERLTKKQAKFVSKCRSIHKDISLNF